MVLSSPSKYHKINSLGGFLYNCNENTIKLMLYEKSTNVNMICFRLQEQNKKIF